MYTQFHKSENKKLYFVLLAFDWVVPLQKITSLMATWLLEFELVLCINSDLIKGDSAYVFKHLIILSSSTHV